MRALLLVLALFTSWAQAVPPGEGWEVCTTAQWQVCERPAGQYWELALEYATWDEATCEYGAGTQVAYLGVTGPTDVLSHTVWATRWCPTTLASVDAPSATSYVRTLSVGGGGGSGPVTGTLTLTLEAITPWQAAEAFVWGMTVVITSYMAAWAAGQVLGMISRR